MSAVEIGSAPALEQDVRLVRTPSPAAIVIFGATCDLTRRKLVPALYSLATQQLLAPETAIVGAARSYLSDDEFRERMRTAVEQHARVPIDEDIWDGFARRLSYVSVPFDDTDAYARLRTHLEDLDTERGHRTLRIVRKGGKHVTVPLAPRTARALDLNLGERNSGIRRAEIEGQIDAYKRDPGRLSQVATAYADRNPGALVWKHLEAGTVGRMAITGKDNVNRKVRSSMRQLYAA